MNTATQEAPKAAVTPAPAKKKVNTILPDKFGLAEHKEQHFIADVHPDVTLEDVCDPAFWSHVAVHINPLDRISVRWEDGSKIVHLRVTWCERTFARVKVVGTEDLGAIVREKPASMEKYKIDWKGPTSKYCVIRNSDSAVLSDGHKDRGSALAWITEQEKA